MVEHFVIQAAVFCLFILYVGFFALHAAQHVADPVQRAGWLLIIIWLTIFGTTLYLFTKYQKFRAIGKGKLIVDRKWTWSWPKEYFNLSETEKLGS